MLFLRLWVRVGAGERTLGCETCLRKQWYAEGEKQGPGSRESCPKCDSIADHTAEVGSPGPGLSSGQEGRHCQFRRLVGVLAMNLY